MGSAQGSHRVRWGEPWRHAAHTFSEGDGGGCGGGPSAAGEGGGGRYDQSGCSKLAQPGRRPPRAILAARSALWRGQPNSRCPAASNGR